MIFLLCTLGYLLVGLGTARLTYVEMTDHPERHMWTDSYGRRQKPSRNRAIGFSVAALPFWPFYLIRALAELLWRKVIMQPTPKQRAEKKKQELERVRTELERIGKEYDLPVVGTISDGKEVVHVRHRPGVIADREPERLNKRQDHIEECRCYDCVRSGRLWADRQ